MDSAILSVGSTLIGAILGAFGAWWAAKESVASQQKTAKKDIEERSLSAINSTMLRICELGIKYPYFESRQFCASFTNDDKDDSIRYINYCCVVFNAINMAWQHSKKFGGNVSDIIGVKELVLRHNVWWKSDLDNFQYEWEFIQYINGLIDNSKKDGSVS